MKDRTQIWVAPQFKKKLKQIAAEENTTLLELSGRMAGENELSLIEKVKPKRQRGVFDDFHF